MRKEFLFEIGVEELPSIFLEDAIQNLKNLFTTSFKENRLDFDTLVVYATPRRLCFYTPGLEVFQKVTTREIIGPPAKIGFDKKGKITEAAIGFARANNVPVEKLEIIQTQKGDYIGIKEEMKSEDTSVILPQILTNILLSITFPKSMKWDNSGIKFARPFRWLLAIFGSDLVNFTAGGIKSGTFTYGHRVKNSHPINVASFQDYKRKLLENDVILDQNERRNIIINAVIEAVTKLSPKTAAWPLDEELITEAVNKTEYPKVISGTFPREYLELPKEVLSTSMKKHQGFFSVYNENGRPLPYFISVININTDDYEQIRKGNEKVLRSRLEDAKFYFESDCRITLEERVEGLKKVVFHQKLGTLYEKVKRVGKISNLLSELLKIDNQTRNFLERAAYLSKADLITGMVGEFPELQGIIGKEYALLNGEAAVVANAIPEQYMPKFAGDTLPRTITGALLSISDKLDTIIGCFAAGIIPSGSQDPYSLRRQALGITQILIENKLDISLEELIGRAFPIFEEKLPKDRGALLEQLSSFFRGRLEFHLKGTAKYDVVNAVLAVHDSNPYKAFLAAEAMTNIFSEQNFTPLILSIKRISNILPEKADLHIDESLLTEKEEEILYSEANKIKLIVEEMLKENKYKEALPLLSNLNLPVTNFFDKILVMAEDASIRNNRFALLKLISGIFRQFGDFSKLVIEQK